jgi:hypothetical protein
MEWHLLKDGVIPRKGRIDHGEIPLIGEVEEVHLHFPTGLPVKNFCVPCNLGGNLKGTAQVCFLLARDLRPDANAKAPRSLIYGVGVEINFRRTRQ